MSFLYPWGLLGLIGIPILIIIYIIRNRYKEHIVSSSYLFELSEKFLKRKKILRRFEGLLSLIFEIIAVLFLSISLAHPVFYLPDQAENICFILDASGSMNIAQDGKSRFEKAKEQINSTVSSSLIGSTYTLIYAGSESQTIAKRAKDKDIFYQLSNRLTPEDSYIELDDALDTALSYYQNGEISKLIVYTDKTYTHIDNVEWVNLSNHEQNYAIYDLSVKEENNRLIFEGNVLSYEEDTTLSLSLLLDDNELRSQEISVLKDIETPFQFDVVKRTYEKASVKINNEDSLALDNEDSYYPLTNKNKSKIALVSKSPFYIQAMIRAIGIYDLDIIAPEAYVEGEYDLYIFDSYTPSRLPENSSVWFINIDQNVDHSGFLVQDHRVSSPSYSVRYQREDSPLYRQITEGTHQNQMMLYQYYKYSLYEPFTTILSYDSVPLLFVGTTEDNAREVVFSFALDDSDLPILYDFIPLMRNLLNYSLPSPIEDKNYVAGDDLQINVSSGFESARITTPSEDVKYISFNSNIEYYRLKEVGTYKIQITSQNETRTYPIYVGFSKDEGYVTVTKDASFALVENANIIKNTSIVDQLMIIVLLGAIFFILDWMVYAHEQY